MKKIKQTFLKPFLLVCFGLMAVSIAIADNFSEPPSKPGRPDAFNVTAYGCYLSYRAPLSDGGSPIIGYIIECRDISVGGRWIRKNKELIPELLCEVTGAKDGLELEFRVRAENLEGISEPSETSSVVIFRDPFKQ